MGRDVRPWGWFEVLLEDPDRKYWVKKIHINAGNRTSLQKHSKRSEIFLFMTDGYAVAGKEEKKLKEGEFMFIPVGTLHRIIAKDKDVEFIELSWGEVIEEDIVRLEDDYKRV